MKILMLSLLVSFSAMARCPEFASQYRKCQSTDKILAFAVKAKEPFFKLTFVKESGTYRQYVITDGELRDITIQSPDGTETNYIESARCEGSDLKITRIMDDSLRREETLFSPSENQVHIQEYANGILTHQTTCFSR